MKASSCSFVFRGDHGVPPTIAGMSPEIEGSWAGALCSVGATAWAPAPLPGGLPGTAAGAAGDLRRVEHLQGTAHRVDDVAAEELPQIEAQRGRHVRVEPVATGPRVVARVQRARVAGEAALDRAGREGIGQQQVQRVGEVRAGRGELAEDRLQQPEVLHGVLPRLVDHPGADVPEPGQTVQHRHEQVALRGDDVQTRPDAVERGLDRLRAPGEGLGQRVHAVQRAVDLLALLVQTADQDVEGVEGVADGVLPALERDADLAADGLQLGEPAAVEHQGQRAEQLLHLDVAVGPVQRDEGPVRQLALGVLVARGRQLDVLLPQQGGLLDHRDRVGGEVDVAVDLHGDQRRPVVGQLDLLDPADRDVGDPDPGLRDEVQDVEELDLHGVGVLAQVGTARQGQRVRPAETAAGQQEDSGRQRGTAAQPGPHEALPVSTGRPRMPPFAGGPVGAPGVAPVPNSCWSSSSRSGVPLPSRSSGTPSLPGSPDSSRRQI